MATKRLLQKLQEEEKIVEKETPNVKRVKKNTIEQIISKDGAKDKQISGKVNRNVYDAFTRINKLQGISNNSALNMLITKYIRENKEILNDENIF